MKAVIQTGYGSVDTIKNVQLDRPTPGEGEVLVRVHAASLAAGDYFGMRGTPFIVRFWIGFPQPKKDHVVGLDLAGTVEAVGPGVSRLAVGDEVFGEGTRACAEFAVAEESKMAAKPSNLTFEQAAAVPTSALTALQGIRDQAKVQPGQKVLINGASGGVGPFAVQIAKALGAEVTGVCSTHNVEQTRSIGADHAIDYTQEDFTAGEERYDVIFDNVGSHTLRDYWRVLAPGGVHIPSSGHAGLGYIAKASLAAIFVGKQGGSFAASPKLADLEALTKLIEAGKVMPVIDRTYPLEETREAFAYLDEGHARGKVVISVIQGAEEADARGGGS